jgi:predicted ATPase/DNA-binding SARP family transcriptional activator
LTRLRQAHSDEWLAVGRETIGLVGSQEAVVDVVCFRALLAECREHGHPGNETCAECLRLLEEAVTLYRGDFMTGFTLRDSPQFDEWQALETEVLRRELARALERLAEGYAIRGDVERGIVHAQRWLSLDSLDQAAQRALMRWYAADGQQTAALRQYDSCERVLLQELGVSPSRETTDLYGAIKEGQVPQVQHRGPSEVVAGAPRHNLPPQPTPFVGREEDLAQVAQLLADPACRLLTVVGPGGMGKSRLAIQAAEEHFALFRDGVWFVPLASVDSADLLPSVIMEAIDAPRYARTDPKAQLLDYLRGRNLLLILDNLEHLLQGVGLVAEMLGDAPGIKIVVTSRERLNLRGEWLLSLEGMEYPEDEGIGSVGEEEYSALELFVQCARRVRPEFSLASAGPASVARICRLVEGMPLAIELAAVWARAMPCRRIAREIEGGLGLLVGFLRDVPQRHRSIRAVFDHSWGLLSDEERRILRQLSVFRGGFRWEAAETIAGASLATLTALVDSSWLRPTPTGRYEIHELVRQYCAQVPRAEQVRAGMVDAESGQEQVRDRHSRYFGAFLQEREQRLQGRGQVEAFSEILEDIDNVWAAWGRALEKGDVETIGRCVETLAYAGHVRRWYHEVMQAFDHAATVLTQQLSVAAPDSGCPARRQTALVLAGMLSRQALLCSFVGLTERGVELGQESLGLLQEVEPGARRDSVTFYVKTTLGWLLQTRGDSVTAKRFLGEALALAEEIDVPWHEEVALFWLSIHARNEGRYTEAEWFLHQAITIANEIGEQVWKSHSLNNLGWVRWAKGEYQQAEMAVEEGMRIHQEIRDRAGIGYDFVRLGEIATALGEYGLAAQHFERCFAIADEIGEPLIQVETLHGQGTLALALGQYAEAKRQFGESLHIAREVGQAGFSSSSLLGLGRAALGLGEAQEARKCFCQGLAEAMKVQSIYRAVSAVMGMASLLAEEGDPQRAAEFVALVLQHLATHQIDRDRAQDLLSQLESGLPPKVFDAATARGREHELAEVAAEILGSNANPL